MSYEEIKDLMKDNEGDCRKTCLIDLEVGNSHPKI